MTVSVIGANTGDDYTGSEEVMLCSSAASTNYDGNPVSLRNYTGDGTLWSGLVSFSGLSNIAYGEIISDASLNVYYSSEQITGQSVDLQRLLVTWDETAATYNTTDGSTGWTSGGAQSDGNDRSSVISGTWSPATPLNEYKSITDAQLTFDVQAFVNNSTYNYGWVLTRSSQGSDSTDINQFQDTGGTDGQRPYLSVTHANAPFYDDCIGSGEDLDAHSADYGTGWTQLAGSTGDVTSNSNGLHCHVSGGAGVYITDDIGSADHSVQAYFVSNTNNLFINSYVAARLVNATNFIGFKTANSNNVLLGYMQSGTWNTVYTWSSGQTGHCFKVTCEGSTVRFFVDGIQYGGDQTITNGQTETSTGVVAGDSRSGAWATNIVIESLASGSGAALAGDAAAVATASGALTTAIKLAGAAVGVSSASGALSTSIPLAGDAAATVTADGSLSTAIKLSGAAIAQAAAAAGLTTGIPLAGDALAEALASGGLTVQIRLNGAALAEAVATGDLTVVSGGTALAGDAAAVATASGDLTTEIPLVGAALSTSSGIAGLTTIIQLAGAAASVTNAVGTLDTAIRLEGAAIAEALAGGDLTAKITFNGNAVAEAIASGALSGGHFEPAPASRTMSIEHDDRALIVRDDDRVLRIAADNRTLKARAAA